MVERRRASGRVSDASGRSAHGSTKPRARSETTLRTKRIPVGFSPDRNFRILSIDGGGIKGLFAAAILAELEKRSGKAIRELFDLVAGTSTGSICAAGCAAGVPAERILQIYSGEGRYIFPPEGRIRKAVRSLTGFVFAKYAPGHLEQSLRGELGTLTFKQALERTGLPLCIPASDTENGEPHVYKTPHHPDYYLDRNRLLVDAVMSSAAAPTYFRPYKTPEGYILTDGGLWVNNPGLLAVVEAHTAFGVPFERIRLVSIGYGSAYKPSGWWERHVGGMLPWSKAILHAIDLQSSNALNQARLLLGPESVLRIEVETPERQTIELDDWERADAELGQEAVEVFVRKKLEQFLDAALAASDQDI